MSITLNDKEFSDPIYGDIIIPIHKPRHDPNEGTRFTSATYVEAYKDLFVGGCTPEIRKLAISPQDWEVSDYAVKNWISSGLWNMNRKWISIDFRRLATHNKDEFNLYYGYLYRAIGSHRYSGCLIQLTTPVSLSVHGVLDQDGVVRQTYDYNENIQKVKDALAAAGPSFEQINAFNEIRREVDAVLHTYSRNPNLIELIALGCVGYFGAPMKLGTQQRIEKVLDPAIDKVNQEMTKKIMISPWF